MSEDFPIIIGGFYRSGTTLLRRILDSHSRIHCGPEVKFFKDFFGDYLNDPLAHGRLFSSARSYGLTEQSLLSIFGPAFVLFHQEAARLVGKARWADKNPENVFYLDHWRTLIPGGFKFIHVLRDPLDAMASLREIGFAKTVPADFVEQVELYGRFLDAGRHYVEANPGTSWEIRYEDLVIHPESTVRRLTDWLGEPFESEMLVNLDSPARRIGIEDPKASRQATVHANSIGRGKVDLTAAQRETVASRLHVFMR